MAYEKEYTALMEELDVLRGVKFDEIFMECEKNKEYIDRMNTINCIRSKANLNNFYEGKKVILSEDEIESIRITEKLERENENLILETAYRHGLKDMLVLLKTINFI